MVRRTQTERSEATTSGLLSTAIELFGRRGYEHVSIDEVAHAAGVTKGAVYHHFAGKPALFRSVFLEVQRRLAKRLAKAAAQAADPWSAVRLGCREFLIACRDPEIRQIIVLDGPTALGWRQVRELENDYTMALMREGLSRAGGEAAAELRAHLLIGAMCEAAMLLAQKRTDLEAATTQIDQILTAFADQSPSL